MKRWWRMVLEEPFRVFFPAGILAGIWGVLMWPLVYAGGLGFYPSEAHPRVMLEGFIGAFVLGFLGTAFPRMTDSRPWQTWEFIVIVAGWLAMVSAHSIGNTRVGDALFSGLFLFVIFTLGARWRKGWKDVPPPGFVIVLPALLGTIVAAACLSVQGGVWMGVQGMQWAKLWLYQAFPILPILGIGPFMFPRFFGEPSKHRFDTVLPGESLPADWWKRAIFSLGYAFLFIGSFALEVAQMHGVAYALRGGVILLWILVETPLLKKVRLRATPGTALRVAAVVIVLGYFGTAMYSEYRIGMLHLVFASGIGLITLIVGTRVILGHAGLGERLEGRVSWIWWMTGLVVLGALTRVSADFMPTSRISHHIYAAWSWAAAGVVWFIALSAYFFRTEDDDG